MKKPMTTRLMFIAPITLALMIVQPLTAWTSEDFNLPLAQLAADKGDAKAEYYLARHYAKGDGVPKDAAKAAEYMRQAAEQGFAFAQNDLGSYYAKGLGVKQDYQLAAQWYQKAADQGDALAQFSLGQAFLNARGVSNNPALGLVWLKKSANQNQTDALMILGSLYLEGRPGSIAINYKESVSFFQKAVDQGRFDALNSIGYIYEHGGAGLARSPELALKYYRDAAEKNIALGQMNLGLMYQDGVGGLKRDLVEAYKWLYLASQNGAGVADHYIMELRGEPDAKDAKLTPEQIDEAVRRAEETRLVLEMQNPNRN